MTIEKNEYVRQLVALLSQGKRIRATSLCQNSTWVTLVWRILPPPSGSEQGYTFEVIGRDNANNEHRLLQQSFLSVEEIFGNLPLDPLFFTADPDQDTEDNLLL